MNWLSVARVFLFGARDVWFVVGIPVYFYAVLSDGSEAGNRAAFFLIGCFMAGWIILYGAVQAGAPRLLRARSRPEGALIRAARGWALALLAVPVGLTLAALLADGPQAWLTGVLVAGLLVFGAVFAVNSALHSYLILAFTQGRAGDDGCRVLLHGQCRRAASGHGAVGGDLSGGRAAADAGHGERDDRRLGACGGAA